MGKVTEKISLGWVTEDIREEDPRTGRKYTVGSRNYEDFERKYYFYCDKCRSWELWEIGRVKGEGWILTEKYSRDLIDQLPLSGLIIIILLCIPIIGWLILFLLWLPIYPTTSIEYWGLYCPNCGYKKLSNFFRETNTLELDVPKNINSSSTIGFPKSNLPIIPWTDESSFTLKNELSYSDKFSSNLYESNNKQNRNLTLIFIGISLFLILMFITMLCTFGAAAIFLIQYS